FGLDVVYYGLRRSKFDTRDAEVLGMLDPFVDLAGNALYSRYNSVITLGCKIWTMLVRLPLPSIAPGVPVVIKRLFAIFRQSSSTNSEMIQSCFKLLASVLRSKAAEDLMAGDNPKTAKDAKEKKKAASSKSLLTEEQLRDLIDFVRPDIEEPERQATAFNLIRAILTRRLIVDSLYTLLDTVRSLMITAQADNMRELCRLTWFQFLMDYPLGQRRLANAMSFIVQNATGYEFESGRTSALEIMGVIVSKFADEILLPTAAEPFFLGLVLIIAQDDSPKCREMATHLLPTLVARFDAQRLKRAWILLDQWSEGTAQSAGIVLEEEVESGKQAKVRQIKMRELGRAALQCYGIIAEPLGDRFTARVPALLASLDSALTISLRSWKQAEAQLNTATLAMISSEDDPQRTALVYWETAYAALNTFARFVSAPMYPTQWCRVDEHRRARIWLLAMQHLTHPHAW
ncbi:U3 snoRNP protein, partial [Kickxella alabastrina]